MPDTAAKTAASKPQSTLKLNFLSHGTLESTDLDYTRKFYEEFLGLDVIRTSPISLMIRLGGPNTIAVVKCKTKQVMSLLAHNGLDVETQQEVDDCYRLVVENADKWKMKKISKPILQHGTYSFYFWDCDDNCWEILTNPKGGYSWLYGLGDLEGKGHQDKAFRRPGVETSGT
jgi:catechol-2,3-dioxygenase